MVYPEGKSVQCLKERDPKEPLFYVGVFQSVLA